MPRINLCTPFAPREELALDNAACKREFELVEFFKVLEREQEFRSWAHGRSVGAALERFRGNVRKAIAMAKTKTELDAEAKEIEVVADAQTESSTEA